MGNALSSNSEIEEARLRLERGLHESLLRQERKLHEALLRQERLLQEALLRQEREFEKARRRQETTIYDDQLLYSPKLARHTGLKKPYKQWIFVFATIGCVLKGFPAIKDGWMAMRYTHTADEEVKKQLLKRMTLPPCDIPSLRREMHRRKVRGCLWAAVPMCILAYVEHARRIDSIYRKAGEKLN